ncbi:MAG: protein kinase [Acidobacteriota bacterium]
MDAILDFLRQLDDLVRATAWFQALPEVLREPPGVYGLVIVALVALFVVAMLVVSAASRLLFGRDATGPDLDRVTRRALKRDAKEMQRQGNWLGAGELLESMGRTQQAVDAYRRGGHGEEAANLLLHLGRRDEALRAARDGAAWHLVGELLEGDGEHEDAATAFERAGKSFQAARAWQRAGRPLAAAKNYIAAGIESEAVKLLQHVDGREAADLLDRAVRGAIEQTGVSGLSLDLQNAVRRGVQLWLAEGEANKAFRLAIDSGRTKLAVPVARDYLEPSEEAARICVRAGAPLVAAELYDRLGRTTEAARRRADHYRDAGDPTEAAGWYETAEAWAEAAEQLAAAGDSRRAAALYEQAGDVHSAAELYSLLGDTAQRDRLLGSAHANSPEGRFEADVTVPSVPADPLAGAAGEAVGAATLPAGAPTAQPLVTVRAPDDRAEDDARYRLIEELGRGGMGVVYRAEDRMLQREVAYKVVPENVLGIEVLPEQLLAEARAAAKLSHPNIVQVFDAGRRTDVADAGFFIVMELVRGPTFETILKKQRLPVRAVVQIGRQVCAALAHAHSRRIIHRDLKPSNLLHGEDQRVKLSDFGLARAVEASGVVATQPAGTPSYMAPEQIRGEALSPSIDLYALGCVLFEMLCQQPVFGTGPPSFHHHLSSPPSDPRTLREEVPEALADLLLHCLQKDPAQRPESAEAIGRRLAEIVEGL